MDCSVQELWSSKVLLPNPDIRNSIISTPQEQLQQQDISFLRFIFSSRTHIRSVCNLQLDRELKLRVTIRHYALSLNFGIAWCRPTG
jgi:hypothetical protein